MLTQLDRAQQKWGGNNSFIDQWLSHRRKLLVNYCQLAGLPPYDVHDTQLPSVDNVRQFCGILMDYVSEGHFEVYDQVVGECEKHGNSSKSLAHKLVPKISETTDNALYFNDKYTEISNERALCQLDSDLSKLAHAMETRFELEDELINVLHDKHTVQNGKQTGQNDKQTGQNGKQTFNRDKNTV